MERKTRLELATPTLARWCSTTELLPHVLVFLISDENYFSTSFDVCQHLIFRFFQTVLTVLFLSHENLLSVCCSFGTLNYNTNSTAYCQGIFCNFFQKLCNTCRYSKKRLICSVNRPLLCTHINIIMCLLIHYHASA